MKKISVFCGSSSGNQTIYEEASIALAKAFIKHDFTLLYGGAKIGLMGILADYMLQAGGKVIGVMPHFLIHKEIAHPKLTEFVCVDSMQERKSWMQANSDAFIALPGGFGTLDEIFEMICLGQLHIHQKPCAFLNINGFFNSLKNFLEHAVSQGFIDMEYKNMLIFESDTERLIDKILHYTHPYIDKAERARAAKG